MNIKKIISFACLVSIALLPVEAKYEQSTDNIVDGDTINVRTLNSYRLAGIDAPEGDQPLGNEAKARLKEILESGLLSGLWCLPKADKYGRDVCMITLNVDGIKVDPAEELLREGLAEVEYARFLPPANEAVYKMAEKEAKNRKLGIWGLEKHVKPHEWRRSKNNV